MNLESRPISSRVPDDVIPQFNDFVDCRVDRIYGTKEPTVINQVLLKAACYAQGPKEEAGKIARIEGIEFRTVTELALSFQNILKISNLEQFTSLTKLQLDNNIIEKIENLDKLVNLTWLDLSFNRIEKIENLDQLKKLEDLSLYHNEIRVIDGLDGLKQLKYLSLGKNNITELEHREQAYAEYQITVDQMNEAQQERKGAEMEEVQMQEYREEQKRAFIDELEKDRLFESIMDADPDGRMFLSLPLVQEVLDQYKEKLSDLCRVIFTFGLEEYQKRTQEENSVREAMNDVKSADRLAGIKLIDEFKEYKRMVFTRLEKLGENQNNLLEEILAGYRERIHELWDQLMSNEMTISEQIEELCKEFEGNIRDLMTNFVENTQNYLSKCREAAANFHERLVEATLPYAERLGKNELTETDEVLFPDRESMANALSQSRDNQTLRIDKCEESVIKRANKWCDELIEQIYRTEVVNRHLNRVTEINLFVDYQRTELDNLDLTSI